MKLPSVRQVSEEAGATLRRFPLVLCAAVLATISALILVDHEGPAQPTLLFNILLSGILGIPFLIALSLYAEKKKFSVTKRFVLQTAGVLLLLGYAWTVPTDLSRAPSETVFRFFVLAAALHLLVSVAPFTARGELNGFWNYNKILLMRILTSGLYSVVLYVGLAIALAALDHLFGVSIPGRRYPELWVLINGVFTTWFFLAGVPEDLGRLEIVEEYPKGLKVFAQYILLPIVLVYFVILYAYLAKIVVAWDWPQGWVGELILGFSGTGIFALLLLHPIAGRSDNVWIKSVTRWFYIALVPLVVMLFLALWRRVTEYGVTEERYIALALGAWLFLLVVYFSVSRSKSIKAIPLSLCVLTFLVGWGPWGMFSVSSRSQIDRLERVAQRTGILVDGKVHRVHGEVSTQDAKQVSAILSYLHENHGFAGIQKWFDESLKTDSVKSEVAYKSPSEVAGYMGVEYIERWGVSPGALVILNPDKPFDLAGFTRMAHLEVDFSGGEQGELGGEGISYRVSSRIDTLTFTRTQTGVVLLSVDMKQHAENLVRMYGASPTGHIPSDRISIAASGSGLKVRVCPWHIRIQQREGSTHIVMLNAVILYSIELPS